MGESYLMVDGRRIDLTDEQKAALGVKDKPVRIVKQDKYEVGDTVRVREDLKESTKYGEEMFVDDMLHWCGKNAVIQLILNCGEYKIDETAWQWTAEMFSGKVLPAEPEKREPMATFYCYKDHEPGHWFTSGKQYLLYQDRITFDSGWTDTRDWRSTEDFFTCNPLWRSCLATEVHRPARVGEWVRIVKFDQLHAENAKVGGIYQVSRAYCENLIDTTQGNGFHFSEYVTLDHYHPEPEPKRHPLERVEIDKRYASITASGAIVSLKEENDGTDDNLFAAANYAADTPEGRAILEKWSPREALCRLMRRYAEMNGGEPKLGEDHWTIIPLKDGSSVFSCHDMHCYSSEAMTPRFSTKHVAQSCRDKIVMPFLKDHPGFEW